MLLFTSSHVTWSFSSLVTSFLNQMCKFKMLSMWSRAFSTITPTNGLIHSPISVDRTPPMTFVEAITIGADCSRV